MKKLLIIGGVIIAVFVLIVVLTNKADETKMQDSPYGTKDIKTSTKQLIGDENYSNIILPEDLEKKISSGEPVTAYFFSPECGYCKEMTPILMPIAEEMGVDVLQYNLLEYSNEAASYEIEGTPTLMHFKDGKEVGRLYGLPQEPEESIRAFFNEHESN